eukprot:jgi/Chrzof1/14749/Cz09g14150.t1
MSRWTLVRRFLQYADLPKCVQGWGTLVQPVVQQGLLQSTKAPLDIYVVATATTSRLYTGGQTPSTSLSATEGALVPMLEPGVPKAHSSQDMCAALTALGLGPSTVLHITNAYEAGKLGDMTSDDVVASVKGIMHTLRSLNGLDLAKVLEFGPGLLKTPPHILSTQLQQLHDSFRHCNLPDDVLPQLMSNAERLRRMLKHPQLYAERLSAFVKMYEEIVGQKPQHHFFGARGSMLSYDVDVLRERLLAFIDLLGVEATHKMLSTEPHTLASTQQHLAANKAFLKKQLQLSDAQLSRLAAKAPRLMTYNTDLLEHNLHNIMECLQASTSTVRHLVLGHPQLLLLNRVTLAARVSDLKALLNSSPAQLMRVIRQQPTLISLSPTCLQQKMKRIAKLLAIDEDAARKVTIKNPAMLTFTIESMPTKINTMSKVLLNRI